MALQRIASIPRSLRDPSSSSSTGSVFDIRKVVEKMMEDKILVADNEVDFDKSMPEDFNMEEDCENSKGNSFDSSHISSEHSSPSKKTNSERPFKS